MRPQAYEGWASKLISKGKRIILGVFWSGCKGSQKTEFRKVIIPRGSLILFLLSSSLPRSALDCLICIWAHPALIACPLVLVTGFCRGLKGGIICIANKHCVAASGVNGRLGWARFIFFGMEKQFVWICRINAHETPSLSNPQFKLCPSTHLFLISASAAVRV